MATEDCQPYYRKKGRMKNKRTIFDTSSEVTKKKATQDINAEPEMIELKRMVRAGELDRGRTARHAMQRFRIYEFFELPPEATPRAVLIDYEGLWQPDPVGMLRLAWKTGRTCALTCGAKIRISADLPGWRGGYIID